MHFLAHRLGVGQLAAAEMLMAGSTPEVQSVPSVAQLQGPVTVLGDVHHRSGLRGLHLAGLDLHDLAFKAAAQLGAELALMVQRADAGQLVRATQPRSVHVGSVLRRHSKALVVLCQLAGQPIIGCIDVADICQPHRLDQPVLQGLK